MEKEIPVAKLHLQAAGIQRDCLEFSGRRALLNDVETGRPTTECFRSLVMLQRIVGIDRTVVDVG